MASKILLVQIILASYFLNFVVCHDEFCYMDPECDDHHWKDMCTSALKTRQSPIELKISVSEAEKSETMPKSGLTFNDAYKKAQSKFYIIDTGHSLQMQLNTEPTSDLEISGVEGSTFRFAQLHFHWGMKDKVGSEHIINGRQFSAEGHFVHYNTAYKSFADALAGGKNGDWKAMAVIGVLYAVDATGASSTPTFSPVVEGLKKLGTNCGKLIEVAAPVNMYSLGGIGNTRFLFRYNGSLTTPPCTEAVIWSVFGIPKQIASKEMEMFRQLKTCSGKDLGNNYRGVQPPPNKDKTEIKVMRLQ